MTEQTMKDDMPEEIYLIKNPDLEEDEDSHIIWSTSPDIYEPQQIVGKYTSAGEPVSEDLDKLYGLPYTGEKQPPIDNEHVAEGCEKFSQEIIELNKEPVSDDALREAVERCNGQLVLGRTDPLATCFVTQCDLEALINHALKGRDEL